MRLEERKEYILDFIIRDYIDSAIPVSSQKVSKKTRFEASPATIRNIMMELDEEGYLTQPHTSAGRIPTKKGYRYFVAHLLLSQEPERAIRHECNNLTKNIEGIADLLARHLHTFNAMSIFDTTEHRVSRGLSYVLREPEFEDHHAASLFAQSVEALDDAMPTFATHKPTATINEFGMISTSFEDRTGKKYVIVSLGPQRMNYEKAQGLLNYLYKTYSTDTTYDE